MVRVKSRYLLCEINVSDRRDLLKLDDRAVAGAVRAAVARIHGDYGTAICSTRFWGEIYCTMSGTIRTCQKFLIRYNTQQLHRMLPKCKNEEEKRQIEESILSCSLVDRDDDGFKDELESEEDEV
ncbi:PREDICTED: ribonuclease P/MRP protein subunit POP5 [Cyprinodon variegatus]|uniref:ribonuclease P/MRP protein subunit POP5 n=1 Tax=Cyprinodon variegatus TaxID=28743 RepID=UPI000742C0FD|nr:PREDICTED: ribonuclease P/MRP protein subunit POP5 [Cyprinodon variegatus]